MITNYYFVDALKYSLRFSYVQQVFKNGTTHCPGRFELMTIWEHFALNHTMKISVEFITANLRNGYTERVI